MAVLLTLITKNVYLKVMRWLKVLTGSVLKDIEA